jgi:hypothetical protein
MRSFTGWVYITKAADTWEAQFLDYNIVGDGASPTEALQVVKELAHSALASDLRDGIDPELRRRECDDRDWAPMQALIRKNNRVAVSDIDRLASKEFGVLLSINVELESEAQDGSKDIVPNDSTLAA